MAHQRANVYPNLRYEAEEGNAKPFHKVDADGDGGIELHELKQVLPHVPHSQLAQEFDKYDVNKDGVLSREEYSHMVRRRAFEFANLIVVPKNARKRQPPTTPTTDRVDGPYSEQYSLCPPPIFMFLISMVEIGIFAYHTHKLIEQRGWVGINGPAPVESIFIYNPFRRCEAWRYLTYMLVHAGWVHLCNNIIMQLFLGILLEMVHKWRVIVVYLAGVIFGSLATSLTDPDYYLAGASGGVYALILAHMATVILNWEDMELPWVRVLLFSAFCILDVGIAVYYRYTGDGISNRIGYAAHFGGAVAGLLIGIHVLKNITPQPWEIIVWRVSIVIWVVLAIFAVSWNIFYTDYFPPPMPPCDFAST